MHLSGFCHRAAWLAALVLAGCGGGGGDRVAGGNVGTEAGNAVSARLVHADGRSASGVSLVVRPAQAIDSSGRSAWVRAVTDSQGVARFELPQDGAWTLEARLGDDGVRLELPQTAMAEVSDTLRDLVRLEGVMLGADSGQRVVLPGLARSAVVGSGGAFRFEDLPQGRTPVQLADGRSWTLNAPLPASVVLSAPTEQLRLAWWAVLSGTAPVVGSGLVFDSLVKPGVDSSEGSFQEAVLGSTLGRLDGAALSNAGAFSLSMRLRLTSPAIGSIWLLDAGDSADKPGLRIGVGGGKIRVVASGLDTAFAVPTPAGWATWVAGFDGKWLVVWSGGVERVRLELPGLADRTGWTRRDLGSGGGMQLGAILVWDRFADGATVSARPSVHRF
ncbi:MAG: hypothetical protein IPO40_07375 [Fibrobacteres bacterium]|nr:hypothetical protein [Fibrobacterota bacterium]